MTNTSDGSTASYYELPKGCTQLQDLISHRNLNAQDGEMFRAIYRKGRASHSDELRDAKKVLFYAHAEVERLEHLNSRLKKPVYVSPDNWSPEIIGKRFIGSLAKYNAVASTMADEFGQQNQLMGGAMIQCHDCTKEHCPCVAK
jgi:hypothetical protein